MVSIYSLLPNNPFTLQIHQHWIILAPHQLPNSGSNMGLSTTRAISTSWRGSQDFRFCSYVMMQKGRALQLPQVLESNCKGFLVTGVVHLSQELRTIPQLLYLDQMPMRKTAWPSPAHAQSIPTVGYHFCWFLLWSCHILRGIQRS